MCVTAKAVALAGRGRESTGRGADLVRCSRRREKRKMSGIVSSLGSQSQNQRDMCQWCPISAVEHQK